MIEAEDIKKITEQISELVVTKADFENFRDEYRRDFSNLQTSVDAYAAKADKYFQEFLMLAQKVDRHERWIQQIADKLGIKLEY